MLLNFCLRTILWMACVFTPKLQVKSSSQLYSWSSITRKETFRKFYRNIPYLNTFRLLTSLNSEPWTWQRTWRKSRVTVKTIEFWQLKVICITSERMLSSWHSPFKVARYSFSGSIPPKFEHKLRRQNRSFGKIATTVVLDKDENLLWSRLQRHRSYHSNEMTLLPILLAAVYLGTGNFSSKIIHGSLFLQ